MSPPSPSPTRWRIAVLTALALVAFAANSLLCRLALAPGAIDPTSFAAIRFGTGAITLVAIASIRARRWSPVPMSSWGGSWGATFGLLLYALGFSFAYLSLPTGVGALVLFGVVQLTMIGVGLWSGERPRPRQWLGLVVAFGGLSVLVSPGSTAPDWRGIAWMAAAGAGWGLYSLAGRRAGDPISATTGNFVRAVPVLLLVLALRSETAHAELPGVLWATCSGVLASGLGYAIWYAALRGLTALHAAVVQLAVPILAAAGGVALLDETVTVRLVGSAIAILGGIGLAVTARSR